MDTSRMKVYTVINSNHEGYNLLGVFDTFEAANEAAEKHNTKGKERLRDIYKGDTEEEMEEHFEHFNWWDHAEVVEREMNEMLNND